MRVDVGGEDVVFDLYTYSLLTVFTFASGDGTAGSPLTLSPIMTGDIAAPAKALVSYGLGDLGSAMSVPLDCLARRLRIMRLSGQSRTLMKN